MTGAADPTLGAVLARGVDVLAAAGLREARLHAEYLMAHALDVARGDLFVRRDERLDAATVARYEALVRRRRTREPLQHILGEQPFHDVTIEVNGDVLVPRPETETLVELVLRHVPRTIERAVDLGTGSGCIAVALAHARPRWRIDALDRSERALAVARRNAERAGVGERIDWHLGDFAEPPTEWVGRFDLVVGNPPYVAESELDALEPEVRDHDPREALVAGPTGLEAFERLAPVAHALLVPDGHALFEFGFGQEGSVARLFERAGFGDVEVRADLTGTPRVLLARRTGDRG